MSHFLYTTQLEKVTGGAGDRSGKGAYGWLYKGLQEYAG